MSTAFSGLATRRLAQLIVVRHMSEAEALEVVQSAEWIANDESLGVATITCVDRAAAALEDRRFLKATMAEATAGNVFEAEEPSEHLAARIAEEAYERDFAKAEGLVVRHTANSHTCVGCANVYRGSKLQTSYERALQCARQHVADAKKNA